MRAGALAALALAACAGARPPPTVPRAPDDDLIALLPSGAEGLIEIDVAQLRAWPTTARLRDGATPPVRAAIDQLGVSPLEDIDELVASLEAPATDGAELTIALRGRLDDARLRASLARSEGRAEESEYHGRTIVEGERSGYARVGQRGALFGSLAAVRRSVDVAIGNDEGVRADAPLLRSLERAPGAKTGRPAIRFALRPGGGLRARLAAAGLPTIERLAWLSGALAVGDGFDLGVVLGARDAAGAAELLRLVTRGADDLRLHPTVRALGFARALETLKTATRGEELHLALRVDQRRVDRMVAQLEGALGGSGR